MVSDKQREANRRNAQHSTGPKTQEGKERVRSNALTHGLRARAFDVLPHEDRNEFAARLDAWHDDYQPTTAAEDHLVRELAILSWKKDRADRYEITFMYKRVHEAVKPCLNGPFTDSDSLNLVFVETAALASFDPSNEGERLRRYQASLHRAFLRTLDALTKLRRDEAKTRAIATNEANSPTPIEANSSAPNKANGEIGKSGTGTRPSNDAPIKPNLETATAPNKAIWATGVQASSDSVPKRTGSPRVDLAPIEPNSVGWLDISCLKS